MSAFHTVMCLLITQGRILNIYEPEILGTALRVSCLQAYTHTHTLNMVVSPPHHSVGEGTVSIHLHIHYLP
jgi:hypothetical protein